MSKYFSVLSTFLLRDEGQSVLSRFVSDKETTITYTSPQVVFGTVFLDLLVVRKHSSTTGEQNLYTDTADTIDCHLSKVQGEDSAAYRFCLQPRPNSTKEVLEEKASCESGRR